MKTPSSSSAKYTWDTGSIPDGYYVVRVEASDEQANPDELTLRSSAASEPIRVDNHPPRIEQLKVHKGRVKGRVVDELGPIARIQMSIDAGPWRDVFPTDSLLDSPSEGFDVPIGACRLAVISLPFARSMPPAIRRTAKSR